MDDYPDSSRIDDPRSRDVTDYPGNSKKRKVDTPDPAKKIEKVVEGEVLRRKKPLSKRFAETFIGGDWKTASAYVLFDVLIPAARDALADAASQGVEKMLFGEARSTSRRPGYGGGRSSYVSYNRYAPSGPSPIHRRDRDEPRTPIPSRRAKPGHDFEDVILATRVEAEEVIDRLFDVIARYESVSVRDLYEMLGVNSEYTDEKWGWTDIRGAGVNRIRNGYLLDLPRPEPLD